MDLKHTTVRPIFLPVTIQNKQQIVIITEFPEKVLNVAGSKVTIFF